MTRIIQTCLSRLAYLAPGGAGLRPALHRWRGVRLGRNVWISQFVYLDELYPEAISIGDQSTVGLRTSIFTHFHWGPRRAVGGFKPVVIGNNVFVGPHCVVLPGVRIGDGAVVKAGTVLTRNVPPGVFWGSDSGQPLALLDVPLTPEHTYEEFLAGMKPVRRNT